MLSSPMFLMMLRLWLIVWELSLLLSSLKRHKKGYRFLDRQVGSILYCILHFTIKNDVVVLLVHYITQTHNDEFCALLH